MRTYSRDIKNINKSLCQPPESDDLRRRAIDAVKRGERKHFATIACVGTISFTQRLYSHPELAHTNRYLEFDEVYSPNELNADKQELFVAWQEGQTGFPPVDASMRQLKTMGWMNFRTRAMCATFLCINCDISWHHGAQHYMNYLVDGDLAIDNWQWQMQAGVTNPLSDIFRIYNPNKNIEDKDSNLKFISYWVPELRGYSLPEILAEVYLVESPYPHPILD